MNSPHLSAPSDPFLFFSSFGAHIVGRGYPKGCSFCFVWYVCRSCFHHEFPSCKCTFRSFFYFSLLLVHIPWGLDNLKNRCFVLCCMYVVRNLISATPRACVLVGDGLDTVFAALRIIPPRGVWVARVYHVFRNFKRALSESLPVLAFQEEHPALYGCLQTIRCSWLVKNAGWNALTNRPSTRPEHLAHIKEQYVDQRSN